MLIFVCTVKLKKIKKRGAEWWTASSATIAWKFPLKLMVTQ